jgi:hypothetical protein
MKFLSRIFFRIAKLGGFVEIGGPPLCESVIVAGKIRNWNGKLLDVDLPKLRCELEAARDAIFAAAQIKWASSAAIEDALDTEQLN